MSAQILIQSAQRKGYLTQDGKWTEMLREARVFPSALEADTHWRAAQSGNVELVVLREGKPSLRIPLRIAKSDPNGAQL